ncbi:MAG: transposase [Planctomycetes bacterium]|nr:transposase [Planctomycetota bacterium]
MKEDSESWRYPPPSKSTPREKASAVARSIFAAPLGAADVAGSVSCPHCGKEVPYRLSEVGGMVACPACGEKSIRVGQSLLDEVGPPRRAVLDAPYSVLLVQHPWFSRRSFAAGVTLALAIVSLSVAWVLAPPGSLVLHAGWLTWDPLAAESGRLPPGTAEVDGDLPLPPPDITLEAVEQLLERDDLRDALVQAQVWRQMLLDFNIRHSDPRLVRLEEIIVHLREQLKPGPTPPPAFFKEFRAALDDLREAVTRQDLAGGRTALARAQALFEQHPDELAIYGRSFQAIKHRFTQLELVQEGRAQIAKLLEDAERLINEDQPAAAAEALAQAMFKALRTPMEDAEFEQRDQTVRRLERELRFARGKRAVEEAERCHAENDLEARSAQLQVAFELLPDLPADKVAALLKRARELAAKPIASPQSSSLGRELAFRAGYEEALRFYGRREAMVDLVEHCVKAEQLFRAASSLDNSQLQKVANLIFDTLDSEVGDLLFLPSHSHEVAVGLAQARQALEKANPWRGTPRWILVDRELRSKGDEVAQNAIDRAVDVVLDGDLVAAIRLVEPAQTVGNPELQKKAAELKAQWESRLAVRARWDAHNEAWSEMSALHQQRKYLDVWRKLDEFEKQYPDSPHRASLAKVRAMVRPAVDQAVAQLFQTVGQHYTQEQWVEFRESAIQLEGALLTPDAQARFAKIQQALAELDVRAQKLFEQSGSLRIMGDDSKIVDYRAKLDEVLRLNPKNEEAQKELQRAHDRAIKVADYLLLKARRAGPRSKQYVDSLERVLRLDPEGKQGAEAKELLEKAE